MRFVDEIHITVASGKGGDGCVSFRREAYVPRGGPDGGDGGNGGDLVLEATRAKNTLVDLRPNKTYRAGAGRQGRGQKMHGADGEDLVLQVPVGTIVHDAESDEILADLDHEGARWVLEGGRGGAGNVHFKTSTNRTPRIAKEGRPGEEREVRLELKLIADVGLLGFPNAGKSTLIGRITRSRSRAGAHPFTTLNPQLGVVKTQDGERFVVADMPGLIEGAAEGAGLGLRFLRHVERCRLYVHLVSAEPWQGDPVERLRALDDELRAYDPELLERPQVVALTKVDLVDDETRARQAHALARATGRTVVPISAETGEGLVELLEAVWRLLDAASDDGASPSSLV